MKIAIVDASGFVGQQLTRQLLETTSYDLTLFSHKATKLHYFTLYELRLKHIDGNVLNPNEIDYALKPCDIAIYLVHLMGNGKAATDFESLEKRAATNFANAAKRNKIQRVIYVGGMGDTAETLTKHLESRAATGNIIRSKVDQLIELRTPMIIGKGGAGYEILKSLANKLPIFPIPRWARAKTQPITVNDVVRYIIASVSLQTREHLTIDIGGPEILTYEQVARRHAKHTSKRFMAIYVPFAPKVVTKLILRWLSPPQYAMTVADMIDSAGYSTVLSDTKAQEFFPSVHPEKIDNAF